ncbi:MAG: hypothetical protein AD742_11725 [Methylibium sp. NZG]|nr:MAG: hypothetical protein AD742_11725 [Methylibium sp. NZG]
MAPPAPEPRGGAAVPKLGILMLDTRFPRIVGDIGNAATFDHGVLYATVHGASPQRVVRERDASLLQPFIDAGRSLVRDGATAVTTSCGFLVLFQRELQAALPVPVWTSSLLLLPELQDALPAGRRVGVVTADAASLAADHLRCAGASADTPIEGLAPGCTLQRTLLNDEPQLDVDAARHATVEAAQRLVARHPEVAAIVLECTNLPPYADAVRTATGRPVHGITDLIARRLPMSAAMKEPRT